MRIGISYPSSSLVVNSQTKITMAAKAHAFIPVAGQTFEYSNPNLVASRFSATHDSKHPHLQANQQQIAADLAQTAINLENAADALAAGELGDAEIFVNEAEATASAAHDKADPPGAKRG